jgi:hypothetical protein
MYKLLLGVLVGSALVGCGSDAPAGAAIDLDVTLPDSPLTRLSNVSLIRAGGGFTLAGYDGIQVHWARLSEDGTLAPQASFNLATPVAGPFFAATMKTTPGDQLIAISVASSVTTPGGLDVIATPHTAGQAAPGASVVLASLPTGTNPATVQVAAGAATSGNLGYVAWGIRVAGIPVSYLVLPADAVTTATPSTFLGGAVAADVPQWDCLSPQGADGGFSFGVVTRDSSDQATVFQTAEIAEDGQTDFMTYPLTAAVVDCHIVGAPTSSGAYFMALEGSQSGSTAIDFATFYPKPDQAGGNVTTHHPVLPSALFGDPMNMPTPAWVSSAGGDVIIGLTRRAGPQVVRYTYNGVPHGSSLTLRSANGQSGPVASWTGTDGVYVTYADTVSSGGQSSIKRYFMRVVSPVTLP